MTGTGEGGTVGNHGNGNEKGTGVGKDTSQAGKMITSSKDTMVSADHQLK